MAHRRPHLVFLLSAASLLVTWTGAAGAEDVAGEPPPQPAAATATAPAPVPAPAPKPAPEPSQASTQREQAALDSAKRREAEAQREGDAGLAQRLAALSARWLRVIDALGQAARLEAQANVLEDERVAVQEQTDRMVTLLEQTEARRARALARLQALGLEPSGIPEKASSDAQGGAP